MVSFVLASGLISLRFSLYRIHFALRLSYALSRNRLHLRLLLLRIHLLRIHLLSAGLQLHFVRVHIGGFRLVWLESWFEDMVMISGSSGKQCTLNAHLVAAIGCVCIAYVC